MKILDKELHFISADENYKSITTIINTLDPSGNTITFHSENDSITIEVALILQECVEGMSGKKNSHKVEVSIKRSFGKELRYYEGCGSFIEK